MFEVHYNNKKEDLKHTIHIYFIKIELFNGKNNDKIIHEMN